MASALGGSEDSVDTMYTDDAQQSLGEFINTHILPQSVSVAGGSFMSKDAMIARGDVLLLRSMAPTSVTLAFVDDTGMQQELLVSPDIPVQFLVLPLKGSIQTDVGNAGSENSRPVSMVTYPTVADLLMDCPTYFEANSTYDDPYLPGFSVKPGDRFHYVKLVRNVAGENTERLQCRTEGGELVCLSTRCKGNFTVLKDDTPYSLRQLIDLARVPRRLELAQKNDDQDMQVKENFEENIGDTISKILTCTGFISMSRPQEILEVSPWDSPETSWYVPLDSNLHVRLFSATDYEEPVTSRRVKPEPLSTFAREHADEFPVQATLFAYTKPPDAISHNLSSSREMIIHEKLHTEKLFVKDSKKDDFFAIDESVNISFVQIPQTLSSVFEMMSLPLGSQVRVLADVAADFPEPFILRYGDVLCVTKHDSFSWKFKHSSTGDVPIVKCERLVQNRKPEKLKLPLDLEVKLVLLEDSSQLKVTKLSDIFSGKDEIPVGDVSVLEGNGASYPPLPASLQILELLMDSELLVSPLSSTSAISPLIKTCVKIPLRHKAILTLKRKLEFPDGYFVMPSKQDMVSLGIECVRESEYEELVQARKVATEYEEMVFNSNREDEEDTRSQASSTGRSRYAVNQEVVPRRGSSGTLPGRKRYKDRMKRISQAVNPKNWHWSRGKAAGEQQEENPPPPVSGILALSLQPSHAVANDYIQDELGEGPGMSHDSSHQEAEPEVVHDGIYEEVNMTPSPSVTGFLAANTQNISSPVLEGACSDDAQFERKTREDSPEDTAKRGHHRRRKTDPGVAMLVDQVRPTKPLFAEFRRKSPERCKDGPSEDALEKAPPIRHTRTRSPDMLVPSENRQRNVRCPENVEERSYKHDKGVTSSEGYSAQERDKRALLHNSEPELSKWKYRTPAQAQSPDCPSGESRKPGSPSGDRRIPERDRETQSPGSSYSENQLKSKPADSNQSRKPQSLDSDYSRKSSSSDSEKSGKLKSSDSDKSRKPRSPDSGQSRKPKSPGSDPSKKARSPDSDQSRKPRSPDSDQSRKPQTPDSDQSRKPKLPKSDQSRKPTLPDSDQSTTLNRPRQSPSTLPSEKPRPRDRHRHTSPDSGSPERQENAQSPGKQSERREQDGDKRGKKSTSMDRLLDQSQSKSGRPHSPKTEKRLLPLSQVVSGKTHSPKVEKRLLCESQAVSEKSQSSSAQDSPQRPQRPRRKIDAAKEKSLNRSVDSVDSLSTSEVAQKREKASGEKPAVPPKPVICPGLDTSATCKPSKSAPPVAPRKRGVRIGPTEAEAFSKDSPGQPVLGRRRLPRDPCWEFHEESV